MNNFSFSLKTKIHFGKGALTNLKNELKPYSKILLVTGSGSVKKHGIYDTVVKELKDKKIFELSGVQPNPVLSTVYKGIDICRENNIDFILALGGGSVIDTAKAIAAGLLYHGDIWDLYIDNSKFSGAIKTGCILTIAAAGSESNMNSVITNEKTKEKRPLRHEGLIPEFAILDPTYTYTLSEKQTAAGIADIMAHAFEQYFSPTKDAYLADRLAESVIKTCIKYGPILIKEPQNYEARAEIMWASNIALNGLLGCGKETDFATHRLSYDFSSYYDLTHGVALAILFPNWMKQVFDNERRWKFEEYAINIWELPAEEAEASINKTREFFNSLNLPNNFSQFGITDENFEMFTENIIKNGKTGSFKRLSKEDIISIYRRSL